MALKFNPLTGNFDLVDGLPAADADTDGYLRASDWNTFNNKLDASRGNYAPNPDAEVDASDMDLYNDAGRTDPAYVTTQDLTFTAVAAGDGGNGVDIQYAFHATQSYLTPLVTVVNPNLITVAWYNGPTIANNPTATQLKAAFDAVPGAVAIATCAITGTAGDRQYINGSHLLANGGDVAPVDGTGGVVDPGVTIIRSTSSPLQGAASFLFSKDAANRQGHGLATDFQIDALDKGDYLQVSFAYLASAGMVLGTSSDVRMFIYDVTNGNLIPLEPTTYLPTPTGVAKTYTGKFLSVSTSVNYRLVFHIATQSAAAWDLQIDNILISSVLDAETATEVPTLVMKSQPILGTVTDRMAVMWQDGNTSWRPATMASGNDPYALRGFATNIVGLTADIVLRGYLDGFSVGPFLGYNQYVDTTPGLISPLPSPFTDTGVVMGKGVTDDVILVDPKPFTRLVTSKGGLLTNAGANNGTGDQVLAVGTNGTVPVANSAASLGIQWLAPIVAAAPFTFTAATRTLTIAVSTNSVAGVLSAADHTTYSGYAATIALKANLASPALTGTPTAPTAAAGTNTTQLATTAFVTTADNLKANVAAPTFTGTVTSSTGSIRMTQIGTGVEVKTGTNAKIGQATLVGGTVTVANTSVTANSRIFMSVSTAGGTQGQLSYIKVNGTSFTITSTSVLETSVVDWFIVESIP